MNVIVRVGVIVTYIVTSTFFVYRNPANLDPTGWELQLAGLAGVGFILTRSMFRDERVSLEKEVVTETEEGGVELEPRPLEGIKTSHATTSSQTPRGDASLTEVDKAVAIIERVIAREPTKWENAEVKLNLHGVTANFSKGKSQAEQKDEPVLPLQEKKDESPLGQTAIVPLRDQ